MGTQRPSVRQIGKYVVLDVIGTGGMGIVYRAQDLAIGRTVAIKMLRPRDGEGTTGVFDKFLVREMKSTGNLHHRNIVTVYDSGEQDGSPYLVMEYLEGDPVSRLISQHRPNSLLDKLDVIVQVCDGLQYAHDRNVIHRDIKPANVIVLPDGTAKLVDFGIARIAGGDTSLVQTGQIVGSLSYMSPEQVNSLPLDGRSDIYSTGVMLYELLTYEVPFKGNDPSSTFVRILREEPLPLSHFIPGVPPALQAAMSRALAKNVHDRYQSAEDFGFDLLGIQRDLKAATVADCLKRAEAAMQRGDLERVRVLLQDVIRLDRHNDPANRLLREVRQSLQQQQRLSQIGQVRSQAQVALAGGQFEEALACADQALRLDTTDEESIRLCEQIRNAISRAKAVRQAVNRAEAALFAGDFDEAKDAIEESLRLDPSDSEARALATMINKELAERSRRAQVQGFVDEARRGIAERKFTDAIDALQRAEELDPTDSNVRELLSWAQRGLEQEDRRKYLQEITDQIENALHGGDFSSACTISEMGLQRFPDEPTLLRLRLISEKQRDIAERRRFVHDQGLAVKALTEQDKLVDAVQLLTESLRKYPAEPNLESLLAITKAAIERQQAERDESNRKKALQRAEAEARAQLTQHILNTSIELRRALDGRAALADVLKSSKELRLALEGKQVEGHARDVVSLVLNEVNGRIRARDQAIIELEQIQRAFNRSVDLPNLSEVERRLLGVKAAFPNEPGIQQTCSSLTDAISRAREERNRCISLLDELAQTVETTPTSELTALQERGRKLAEGASGDPRVGALLQQIDFSINRRSARHAELLRDINGLVTSLSKVQSLDDITRICDRAAAIAALDPTDDELGKRSLSLQAEAQDLHASMEALLGKMTVLARTVANAKNIHESETVVFEARELAEKRPDFQSLQDAATRVFAEVQGQRIEHDLIVQELEAALAAVSLVETDEELVAAAARARHCLDLHQGDPTILTLSNEIVEKAESILRERTQLRLRQKECDEALRISHQRSHDRDLDGALSILLSVEEKNPDRVDLHLQISILRSAIEQNREEQERLEREGLERERAEAEFRARRAAIEQSIQRALELLAQDESDEALECLRAALELEPGHEDLKSALELTMAEITRKGEERERLERERIAREKADAERRARARAAEQAVDDSRELLARGQEREALDCLGDALERDPNNEELRLALEATQAEVARRKDERERQERERLERERIAREQAEARARARGAAAAQAVRESRELLTQKQEEESVRRLRVALDRDPENQDLLSALKSTQAEVALRRAERERQEQERLERERIAREIAEAKARAVEAAKQAIRQAQGLLSRGQEEASLETLRNALERDPGSQDLHSALQSIESEVARRREEREIQERKRQQRERVAREKAEAEARAFREAADKAIAEARELLGQGRDEESMQLLWHAVEKDPSNHELRSALASTQEEVGRRRVEKERLERERRERLRQEEERLARERAEATERARQAAAKQAIKDARVLMQAGQSGEAMRRLGSALASDPNSRELRTALAATQEEVVRILAERERVEQERITRERAEAEARARKAAAEQAIQESRQLLAQGRGEESVQLLRSVLQRDPENSGLQSTLDSVMAEVARLRAERERQERERIAREKAETEARARKAAADRAIREASEMLTRGRGEESVQLLGAALERDSQNQELQATLESVQAEVARRRAESERLERERQEQERRAREKAEAEARARKVAADRAIQEARELLGGGQEQESLERLRSSLERDPESRELQSAFSSAQAEIARRRQERERLERERLERERLKREQAEAEAKARKAAADQAIKDARRLLGRDQEEESLERLRAALGRDPENQELRSTLESIQAEVARLRAERERVERERLEQERIAREKAEAEARARRAAADRAINEARQLAARGQSDEASGLLQSALELDPANRELRTTLDSIQREVALQRAEQQRQERERARLEKLAKDKAEAEARARKAAVELAIKEARELLGKGRFDDAVQRVQTALGRDPESQELQSAFEWIQVEVVRQRAERERLERERLERERLEREELEREQVKARERARLAAANEAIQKAQKLVGKGQGDQAVQILRAALGRDSESRELRSALESTQAELARERAAKEQEAKRVRLEEIESALRLARRLQGEGKPEEVLKILRNAAKKFPDSQELKSALSAAQAEVNKDRAEKQRAAQQTAKAKAASEAKTVIIKKPAQQAPKEAAAPSDDNRRLLLIGSIAAGVVVVATIAVLLIRSNPTSSFTFTLYPADATLTVDGTRQTCAGGTCTLSLSSKVHDVVVEKPGCDPEKTVARPGDKPLQIRLSGCPVLADRTVPQPPPSSLSLIWDGSAPAPVSLDGSHVGDLSSQPLQLPGLKEGSHHVTIDENGSTVDLSVSVSGDGSVRVDSAKGLDQNPIVATTRSADRQEIFCRCDGAKISIDGRKFKGVGHNRYVVTGKEMSPSAVKLERDGQSEEVASLGTDPHFATIFVASSEHPTGLQPPAVPDLVAWKGVENSRDIGVLLEFRAKFPQSQFAALAYDKAADLKWETTRNSASKSDYETFLATFSQSSHASEAQADLNRMEKAEAAAAEEAKKRAAEQEQAAQQRAADQKAAEQRAAEQRAAEQRVAEQRVAEQKAAQEKAADDDARKRADRQSVLDALEAYRSAYAGRNIAALLAVYPSVSPEIQKTLKYADKVSVTLDCDEPVINQDMATVTCRQSLIIVTNGGAKTFPRNATFLFTLRKTQGKWHIESVK